MHCFTFISRDVAFRLVATSSLLPDFSLADVSSCLHLNRLESSDMSFWIVRIRKELNTVVVLSGGTDISFKNVKNCDVCIRKELYAECCIVGGTAVFQGLVERITRTRTIQQ